MQLKIKSIFVCSCLIALNHNLCLAAAAPTNPDNEAQLVASLVQSVKALQKQNQHLQSEVNQLQKEVKPTKASKKTAAPVTTAANDKADDDSDDADDDTSDDSDDSDDTDTSDNTKATTTKTGAKNNPDETSSEEEAKKVVLQTPIELKPYSQLSHASFFFGGVPILTSPYLGTRSAFDASDLITNLPLTNEGLHLLQERQKIEDVFTDSDATLPIVPYLNVSGGVQAAAVSARPAHGSHMSSINLTSADIEIMGNINRWTTTFIDFTYDNAPPNSFGPLVSNSRVYLDQGFITLGNLNSFPLYFTMGQIYVPFGLFDTAMVTDPLTSDLANTQERAALLGFNKEYGNNTFDVQTFIFKGDAITSASSNAINEFGSNLDYTYEADSWSTQLGTSFMANLADSLGMQMNSVAAPSPTGFTGFGNTALPGNRNPEILIHRVPAIDLHGELTIGSISFNGEYVTATTAFNRDNLGFDFRGAKPSAASIESVYTFNIFNRPTNIAIGYQNTAQALALFLPMDRYVTTFNISIWKDTIESLEFRHDVNYPVTAHASGQQQPIDLTNFGLGHSSDTITLQLAAFF